MKAANTLIAEAGRTPGMTSDQRAQQLEVRTSTSRDYLSICLMALFPAGSRSATPGGRGTTCTARYGAPANACRRMRSAHLVDADRCSGSRCR